MMCQLCPPPPPHTHISIPACTDTHTHTRARAHAHTTGLGAQMAMPFNMAMTVLGFLLGNAMPKAIQVRTPWVM